MAGGFLSRPYSVHGSFYMRILLLGSLSQGSELSPHVSSIAEAQNPSHFAGAQKLTEQLWALA